jgi:hypothetical protein
MSPAFGKQPQQEFEKMKKTLFAFIALALMIVVATPAPAQQLPKDCKFQIVIPNQTVNPDDKVACEPNRYNAYGSKGWAYGPYNKPDCLMTIDRECDTSVKEDCYCQELVPNSKPFKK